MEKIIKILIADDHYLIAKLVKLMLAGSTEKFEITIVDNGKKVFEFIETNQIDVLILDIDMPEVDGITVLKKLKNTIPEIKIIMISNHTQAWIINRAIKYGADAYISKYADSDEVLVGVTEVLKGNKFYCKKTIESLNSPNSINLDKDDLCKTKARLGNLSKREIEILKLIVDDYNTKEISEMLFISTRTVETHRKHILAKLGVKNSLGLIRLFVENDLLKSIEDK